jgi:hypothetical protein
MEHAAGLTGVMKETIDKWLDQGAQERAIWEKECEHLREGDPLPEMSPRAAFPPGLQVLSVSCVA